MNHFCVTLTLALTSDPVRSTFLEYSRVAYQIKGNEIYNNIQRKLLPEWGHMSKHFSF